MPVQLPSFQDLGFAAPQPTGQIATIREASPMAQAEETLGQGLERAGIAAETYGVFTRMAQNRMDRAMADSALSGQVIRLNEQLKTETDPDKIAAIGGQYQGALADAANAFSDPQAATFWAAQRAHVVDQGQADAALRGTQVARENYAVGIQSQLDDHVRLGAAASDPAAFPVAMQAIADLTDAGRQSGALPPEAAYRLKNMATQKLVAGRADALIGQNQPTAALQLLDQNVAALDPATAESLRARAQAVQQRLAVGAATDAIWRQNGGQAAALSDDVPSAIVNEAQAQGVDPNLALASAQIESGMGARLGTRGNIFQLGPDEWSAAGGGTMGDVATDVHNGVAHLGKVQNALAQSLGRAPTPAETYLGLQQGSAGAAALLQNPTMPAAKALRPFYKSDALARSAIADNGGDPDAPAAQFTAQWNNAYGAASARFPDLSASGNGVGGAAIAASANQPMPDLDRMLNQVEASVARGDYDAQQGAAIASGLRARFNLAQEATATQRAQLVTQLGDGVAQLRDGAQFDYDPAAIRHAFAPEQADRVLQQLDDAKTTGQIVTGVRQASPDQLAAQRASLAAGLDEPNAPDYAARTKQLAVFDQAVAQRDKALNADPASYLIAYSPAVKAAAAALDPAKPQSFQDYATASLAEQARLGVDPTAQHVLGAAGAQKLASALTGDAEHAPETLQGMQRQWGNAWPAAWRDLVTLGHLPPSYEAVATLPSAQDASLLARALSEQANNPGKTWSDLIGAQPFQAMKQQVRSDPDVALFRRSLEAQPGMSATKVEQVMGSIDTLASARSVYLGDPNAAADAVKAFTGQYSFALPGGPRVPADKADNVSSGAAAALDALTPDNVAVPALFGSSPALPSRQDYVDLVKSAPSWVNAPQGDALWLMDNQGRVVRGVTGRPVAVPFDAPPQIPAPGAAMPDSGTVGAGVVPGL